MGVGQTPKLKFRSRVFSSTDGLSVFIYIVAPSFQFLDTVHKPEVTLQVSNLFATKGSYLGTLGLRASSCDITSPNAWKSKLAILSRNFFHDDDYRPGCFSRTIEFAGSAVIPIDHPIKWHVVQPDVTATARTRYGAAFLSPGF